MEDRDRFVEEKLEQIQLSIYLVPVIGFVPALWTIYYSRDRDKEKLALSRLSVTLTLIWLIAYILLWFGSAQTSELSSFRLMYLNTLLTSAYFLVCLGLMLRLWQGKPPRLPGMSKIANAVVRKH